MRHDHEIDVSTATIETVADLLERQGQQPVLARLLRALLADRDDARVRLKGFINETMRIKTELAAIRAALTGEPLERPMRPRIH